MMRRAPIAIDSSALVAIAIGEDGAERFARVLEEESCIIGAPTLLEAFQVLTRYIGEERAELTLRDFTSQPNVTVVPFDTNHFLIAADAFRRFGKGRDHPARLNFGDCLAYAVARHAAAPLLYKGTDFGHTDLAFAPGQIP